MFAKDTLLVKELINAAKSANYRTIQKALKLAKIANLTSIRLNAKKAELIGEILKITVTNLTIDTILTVTPEIMPQNGVYNKLTKVRKDKNNEVYPFVVSDLNGNKLGRYQAEEIAKNAAEEIAQIATFLGVNPTDHDILDRLAYSVRCDQRNARNHGYLHHAIREMVAQ